MIKLLKSNPALAFVLVPLFVIFIWVQTYITGLQVIPNGMPLYSVLLFWLPPVNTLGYCVIALVLVLFQAFYFNYILNKNEIISKNSWIFSLFYMLLMSLLPQFLVFHPMMIGMTIIVIVFEKIFNLYKSNNALAINFDIGLLISLAALFYFPLIVVYLLYMIALIILKPFAWRDWIVGLMGLVLPFFFMFTYYFLTDQFQYLTATFYDENINNQIDWWRLIPRGFSITIAYVSILLALAVFQLTGNFGKNVIRIRNLQQVLLIFIIVGGILLLITRDTHLFRFTILCLPFAFLLTYYFTTVKKIWYAEVLFWLLIANMVYNFYLMDLVKAY
jgi:hypothetical protein